MKTRVCLKYFVTNCRLLRLSFFWYFPSHWKMKNRLRGVSFSNFLEKVLIEALNILFENFKIFSLVPCYFLMSFSLDDWKYKQRRWCRGEVLRWLGDFAWKMNKSSTKWIEWAYTFKFEGHCNGLSRSGAVIKFCKAVRLRRHISRVLSVETNVIDIFWRIYLFFRFIDSWGSEWHKPSSNDTNFPNLSRDRETNLEMINTIKIM